MTGGRAGQEALATFKDLCLDAVDVEQAARFWAPTLGLKVRRTGSDVSLVGTSETQTIWINQVPEPKTVKNRVHLDVHTGSLDELTGRGARVVAPATDEQAWTVFTDPDGQEFCGFVREQVPDYRLYEVIVDCADGEPVARWWASVLGGELERDGADWALTRASGVPFEYLVFGAVPEPKTVKNRVHWDVWVADPQLLIDAGATLLRPPGLDTAWHVLADPAGNEFCAFVPSTGQDATD
ncbi:VOC family protein [Jatrophihabitans sp.]|uniref:VOC family protein n=1 Tax=Jatrophihabitans sp. TaxID=1932789 RepID=UPI002BB3C96C|nr:VOC family protein [Jatrophihabitans sp.]